MKIEPHSANCIKIELDDGSILKLIDVNGELSIYGEEIKAEHIRTHIVIKKVEKWRRII